MLLGLAGLTVLYKGAWPLVRDATEGAVIQHLLMAECYALLFCLEGQYPHLMRKLVDMGLSSLIRITGEKWHILSVKPESLTEQGKRGGTG